MDKIAELRAKHEKELSTAIRHEQIKATAMSALGLTDANFAPGFMHAHKADCYVIMEADTLPDALALCEKMNPLQAARLKGTFCSFRAERTVTDKDRAGNTETLIPYFYVIDGLRQYGEEKTLHWFVDAAGLTVEVRCKVKSDPLTRRDYKITFDRNGNPTRERNNLVNQSGYFRESHRFYSSDDQPSMFVLVP